MSTDLPMTLLNFMTIDDAAVFLAVKPGTVRAAIRRGRLRGYRIGRRVIVLDRADVEAYRRSSQRRGS